MNSETPPDDNAGPLAALAVERITDTVEAMHTAIASPWNRAMGGIPGVSTGRSGTATIYSAVRTIGAATAGAAAHHRGARGRIVPVGNALWGDELQHRKPDNGADTTAIVKVLVAEPKRGRPTKRCAVLLHGLGETESVWHEAGIVDRLTSAGHPVVLVRYNSGRSVAETGLELAATIDKAGFGGEPMTLVGFSMGGLIARAAIESAHQETFPWVDAAEDPAVITIGTPHQGSPIEQGVELASRALRVSPYSRPLAEFVEQRSAGIQDLRHGMAAPTDDLEFADGGALTHEVATIAGTVAENPDGPWGRLFGDLVVRPESATAAGEDKQVVFGGVNHRGLLGDERVQAQLLEWLAA